MHNGQMHFYPYIHISIYPYNQQSKKMKENRVIDRLVVFGVPNPQRLKLSQIIENKIKVSALEFYSLNNTKKSHENQIDYQMWAYPDGIKIFNQHSQILNDNQPEFTFSQPNDIISEMLQNQKDSFMRPKSTVNSTNSFGKSSYPPDYIYSFVLTDYELNRTYCTCLSWYEKYFVKNNLNQKSSGLENSKKLNEKSLRLQHYLKDSQHISKVLPKCKTSTIVNNPMILDPSVTLVYIPKSMIICSSRLSCFQLQRKLLKYFYISVIIPKRGQSTKNDFTFKIDQTISNIFDKMCMNNGYSSAEKYFDHKRIDWQQKQQFMLSNHQNKQKILSVPKKKLKQFYIASFFLLQKQSKKLGVISENGFPIASHITLKTAYSLPEHFQCFTDNSILLPLPIQKILILWKCLLLEKQVLIFGHSQYQSILLCQLLLYLLKPIKWQNIYIPFLPFHLSHHIDAIGGYLIGMSAIHMNYMIQNFDLKSKVVVDLKNKTILQEGGIDVLQLPITIKNYLQTNLQALNKKYQTEVMSLQTNSSGLSYLIPFGQSKNPLVPIQISKRLLFVRHTLEMEKYFFNAIVYLFNNFIPFIEKRLEGVISFQTKDYLQILDDQNHRKFMKQISKTMVFIRLCEYHLQESQRCAWVQKTLGELFVYSHDILSQKYVVKATLSAKNLNNVKDTINAWPLEQLLNPQYKYYQYHHYLFQKNTAQICQLIKTMDLYFIQEAKQNQYIYQSSNGSSKSIRDSKQPLVFNLQKLSPESDRKNQKRKQVKWKRYGQKDEEDMYEQASKIVTDEKLEKYLVKYLQYLELSDPKRIIKTTCNMQSQNNEDNKGWFSWFAQIINPPTLNRQKVQKQMRTKLKRKDTQVGYIFNDALDLKGLFKHLKDSDAKVEQQLRIEDIQNKNSDKKILDFCEYDPEKLRISKAHSEDLKLNNNNNTKKKGSVSKR